MTLSRISQVIPIRPEVTAQPPPLEDAELVRHACEGRVWAQAELFRRHARPLTVLLTRLLGSTSEAEDAVQDTFVVAFGDLRQLREPAAVGGWLRQVAVHQAHRRFRRRRLLAVLGLDRHVQDATLEQLASPEATPEQRTELGLLDRALTRLPARDRLAWMLRFVEGHELTEVAELCGCSLATAKRRIAAAQEHIARHVDLPEDADG